MKALTFCATVLSLLGCSYCQLAPPRNRACFQRVLQTARVELCHAEWTIRVMGMKLLHGVQMALSTPFQVVHFGFMVVRQLTSLLRELAYFLPTSVRYIVLRVIRDIAETRKRLLEILTIVKNSRRPSGVGPTANFCRPCLKRRVEHRRQWYPKCVGTWPCRIIFYEPKYIYLNSRKY